MKTKILVSSCLIGVKCRYDGKSCKSDKVIKYLMDKDVYPVCPEVLGGLSTPRTPCEIIGTKVISKKDKDNTKEFKDGADKTLALAKKNDISIAILKSNSPSCGYGSIYDGSFSSTLVAGNGLTADLLSKNDITIYNETQIDIIK